MKKILKKLPLLMLYIAIIYLSLKHTSGEPSKIPYIDKIGHLIAYMTLGLTTNIVFNRSLYRKVFVLLGFITGIALEFIQEYIGYRSMSLADAVADTFGLILGVILFYLFYKQIKWILKKVKLDRVYLVSDKEDNNEK